MDGRILLVDDEKDILDLLEEVLRRDGFREIRQDGAGAIRACREFLPDAVVLDIMLPDLDGLEVCKQIREFSYCSILFLSSKNDDIDKILGLSCGGDDYITKPFSPREVVFRVKAQLRRQQYQGAGRCGERTAPSATIPLWSISGTCGKRSRTLPRVPGSWSQLRAWATSSKKGRAK